MHDLTLQFVNLAASPASLIASDDLEIFERCQRGLESLGRGLIDLRRGAAADGATPTARPPAPARARWRSAPSSLWRRCMSAEEG